MFCMYCGKEIPDDSAFCLYCGREIPGGVRSQQDMDRPVERPARQTERTGRPAERPVRPAERPVRQAERTGRPAERPVRQTETVPVQQTYRTESYAVPAGNRMTAYASRPQEQPPDPYSLPTKKPGGIRSIYMFDFFARMLQRQNIPMLIYLFFNYLIVSGILLAFFGLPVVWGLVAGLVVYAASVAVALSPIGELKLRTDCGCTKITDPEVVRRLDPIFREVYYRAKKANPAISADVRLYMNEDESENAFATGRKTICITRGLLRRSDEEIKAILGHEFGHLAHRDTDRVLVVAIGNTFISLFFTMVEIGIWIMDFFMNIAAIFSDEGILIWLFSTINRVVSIILIRSILSLWTWIGCMLCMKTSRGNEYQADEFSWYLGYGRGLIHFFNSMHEGRPKGLFANLERSHPVAADRVDHLMELDAA